MKKISVNAGRFALVDDEDYEWLMQWKWSSAESGSTQYAHRKKPLSDKSKPRHIKMHRMIMDTPRNLVVDHIDGNGLNNQKYNLRNVTLSQNSMNQKTQERGICLRASRYKGVYKTCHGRRWVARIKKDQKSRHLGVFATEEAAAIAYNSAATGLFGECARLNNIPSRTPEHDIEVQNV